MTRAPGESPKPASGGPAFGRARGLEETERAVRSVLRKIPVSRISDLTPLDSLGLPTYSVTTPLARDLTTHLGKGVDPRSARVSALMEAVERVSAESVPPELTVRASGDSLRHRGETVLDPEDFDLPAESAWDPARTCTWHRSELWRPGRDPEPCYLPADLTVSPPSEGILRAVDTNGLAAGNTRLEAMLHGLCEGIERDAQGQLEFQALFGDPSDPRPAPPIVDLESLPVPASSWARRVTDAGLFLTVHDLTGDVRVPGFRALILDPAYPTGDGIAPLTFAGWGTSPNASTALLRAITEAVQSRLGFVQGARDSWNSAGGERRPATLEDRARAWSSGPTVAFEHTPAAIASTDARDLETLRAFLQDRLAAVGLDRVVVADLTRPDLGLPVVRVRVPGLSSFLVNRGRVGWRCRRHLL